MEQMQLQNHKIQDLSSELHKIEEMMEMMRASRWKGNETIIPETLARPAEKEQAMENSTIGKNQASNSWGTHVEVD